MKMCLNQKTLTCARLKGDMRKQVGDELGVGWRAAEAMHWQLGEQELERRANLTALLREEHTKHSYQARDQEQHEAGESDNSSQSQEFYEWEIPPLAHSIMVTNRRYYCGVPKCKGSPSLQKEVAGNIYMLTSNQFNARSANGEHPLNPR
uniref:Uncharacterized protein n=1 Tax=Bionectria ochroleuca TaxID=29856 RepID=A0A0B7KQG4_BIOOC